MYNPTTPDITSVRRLFATVTAALAAAAAAVLTTPAPAAAAPPQPATVGCGGRTLAALETFYIGDRTIDCRPVPWTPGEYVVLEVTIND